MSVCLSNRFETTISTSCVKFSCSEKRKVDSFFLKKINFHNVQFSFQNESEIGFFHFCKKQNCKTTNFPTERKGNVVTFLLGKESLNLKYFSFLKKRDSSLSCSKESIEIEIFLDCNHQLLYNSIFWLTKPLHNTRFR